MDVCALSRPYDDQSQLRIRMESDAVLLIMDAVQKELYDLMSSPVHFAETGGIKDDRERVDIEAFLLSHGHAATGNMESVRERAEYFCTQGFGTADAAHLAFAEAGADVMISCDDRFVRKARKTRLRIELLTPLEFCEKERI